MDQQSTYSRSVHRGRRRRRRKTNYNGGQSVRSQISTSSMGVSEIKLFELNKWQNLCKGLWFQIIVESNPSSNKQSLNGFIDAINWVRNKEITKNEFKDLFDAWIKEGEIHSSAPYYSITESKILISFSSFRHMMIMRKYNTSDLTEISSLLLEQANNRELKKGYFSRTWLMLLDSFFFTLDVYHSGILTVDDVLYLCLARNQGKYNIFNDKRQQIERGLSNIRDNPFSNFDFNADISSEVLRSLTYDCYQVLAELGAREGPLTTPYKGLVTLHVFKQQVKRMAVRNTLDHPYSEIRIQKLMANIYSLRTSVTRSNRRTKKVENVSLWHQSIMKNTIAKNEESIKLSMFLCHEGSCLRWAMYDSHENWRSKKQIHSIWVAFKEEKQIFNGNILSTLFLQLENTVNTYVSTIVNSLLIKKRLPNKEPLNESLRPQERALPSIRSYARSRFEDDTLSIGRHSTRSNNTYNNFNINLVQDLQQLHYNPKKQPKAISVAKDINQLSKEYIGQTRKLIDSSFANKYNNNMRDKESVILSGKYFDVFNQLSKQHNKGSSRERLDFREVDIDDIVQEIAQDNNNQEAIVNSRSLIPGEPTEQQETHIDRVNQAYNHLQTADLDQDELLIHTDSIFAKNESNWMKTNIGVIVRREHGVETFFMCIYDKQLTASSPREMVALVQANVRPLLISKHDEHKDIAYRFQVSTSQVKYEFGSKNKKQQAYLIRLLCFAISTSRTTNLLAATKYETDTRSERDKQFDDFSVFQGQATALDNQSTFGDLNITQNHDRSGFYEDAKSVVSHKGNEPLRAPSRPAPVATPVSRPDFDRSGASFAGTLDSVGSYTSHRVQTSEGKSALDRLTQATEQLRRALEAD